MVQNVRRFRQLNKLHIKRSRMIAVEQRQLRECPQPKHGSWVMKHGHWDAGFRNPEGILGIRTSTASGSPGHVVAFPSWKRICEGPMWAQSLQPPAGCQAAGMRTMSINQWESSNVKKYHWLDDLLDDSHWFVGRFPPKNTKITSWLVIPRVSPTKMTFTLVVGTPSQKYLRAAAQWRDCRSLRTQGLPSKRAWHPATKPSKNRQHLKHWKWKNE